MIKLHILKVDKGRVLTTGRPSVLHSWVDGSRKLQIGEILEEKEESNMSEEELKKIKDDWNTGIWSKLVGCVLDYARFIF